MRLFALGCIVFLLGAWFGFYEAHAASGVKYDGFVQGKDVPKMSAGFMNGYVAGAYDMLGGTTWVANEDSKDFTADVFTKQYQCLQKIPNASEGVAWAKDLWSKNPNAWASDILFAHACEYNTSARANTMVKGGQSQRAGAHSITLSK